jgi:hypothetical protein
VLRRREALRTELVKRRVGEEELRLRGFGIDLAPLPGGGQIDATSHSLPLWWAAFTLSGDGR